MVKKQTKQTKQSKQTKKIIKYRRPLNINVGMIIFALIFVYMASSVYTYIKRDKIQFYEVVDGSIVNNKNYTGIALRKESVKRNDRAGYISYYVSKGKRVSVGTRVYSIDETGSMSSFLEDNPGLDATLSDEDLGDLKRQLSAFSLTYRDENFSDVYGLKSKVEADVLDYVNFNALENADSAMDEMGVSFQQVKADEAGVMSNSIDGYEGLEASGLTEALFDKETYKSNLKTTKSGEMVGIDTAVYKVVTSEKWSLGFLMSEEDIAEYGEKTNLTITFAGYDLTVSGPFSMIIGEDDKTYGKIDLNKYMVKFVSERFINFEIVSDRVDGLKIPVSSVTNKDFYLMPADYLTQGGDSSESGFLKEVLSDTGTSTVFVPTTLYYSKDNSYYIDMGEKSSFKAGDYIVKPNSTERYQVASSASLQGVYNINKGYAVFKQIEVLASNNEFYTIKKNVKYGLSVYDHIVLDAQTITEGDLIY